ncbi:MAG: hypothetical protein AB1571_00435 [Nanoarchaeota archaeon]
MKILKFVLFLLVLSSVLFIGACSNTEGSPAPAYPSGGGCGVSSVNGIASICSSNGVEDGGALK